MHIHILGICGTFMGSMAILATQLGHKVTGSDANVYPPMSTQLAAQGITLMSGYKAEHLQPAPDLVVVGNALSRGNPAVEYMLDKGLKYTSGAQWLKEYVLQDKWVLAVAGTHGKTTTASMLAYILEYANMKPGYLIGGVPTDFAVSARLGESPFFVLEADEYDTAFFDKRSKFVHYMPRTLVINNLEYDHADIFPDLAAIQRQFHHLLRVVPAQGQVIYNADQVSIASVLEMGCWSETQTVGAASSIPLWSFKLLAEDGSHFALLHKGEEVANINWQHSGLHNVYNAMMALVAARHVGVDISHGAAALSQFQGVKRRMELLAEVEGVSIYDDFAHHPTAIETTLTGLRKKVGTEQIIAVIEPRSNTMRLGCHQQQLAESVRKADVVIWYQPQDMDWQLDALLEKAGESPAMSVQQSIDAAVDAVFAQLDSAVRSSVVIMSNGGFGGIHQKIVARLQSEASSERLGELKVAAEKVTANEPV
ncbi:MAG: UDP-N-acetylmuramate:L-alanyl-gamma-D-glutamyl-meso-diaminopimelate ligase [Oceanospirillaceae bacterium]|nr:UDP-N-acetylmuramate:L-alanyl-gamma-D-glutamyl-meso-diaminopimelate ligase [Oceanospirillaceae bacterium]